MRVIHPEFMPPGVPFPILSKSEDQEAFKAEIESFHPDIIFFDTLTGCFRFDTNDTEAWDRVNYFLKDLRYKGYCVLTNHHAGKSGTQRGRTDGDDNLDVSIKLTPPEGWEPGQGLRFNWTYEKVRHAGDLPGFSAKFDLTTHQWIIDDEIEQAVLRLLADGALSIRQIAEEVGWDRDKIQRLKKKSKL